MNFEDAQEFHYTQQESLGLFSFLDRPPSVFDDVELGGIPLSSIEEGIFASVRDAVEALEDIEDQAQGTDTSLN